ncbi:MAG TPA: ABC transporter ATP-binding protein [Actinomycetes bacterium]|nr:ABC transporter ATP-binding protein [Actinomycetes bacterium]
MSQPVIRAVALSKRFGSVEALRDLDLEVQPGEVFGYLGPNGAGKTTTIRLLLDFIRPTSGRIEVLGGTGADPAVRRRIGYLPAELPIDPRWTARDLIDFYGTLRGGVDAGWVQELLGRFDLDPGRRLGELSTGNRRKVGIVQAVIHRPELLVLDEPSGGLDPLLQYEFQRLVRELAGAGTTVFLSSHVLPEVEALAGRVAILRRGELVTVAGVEQLRQQARQRIELRLARPADAGLFAGVPGVVEAKADDTRIRLVVEGPMGPTLRAAAGLEVQRIVTHEVDLEDVFLSYYQEQPA